MNEPIYWENRIASEAQIQEWVEKFHRDGFLFIENVLTPNTVAELKADLEDALKDDVYNGVDIIELKTRMFERSAANLALFSVEPIVTFAESLIGSSTHVIHNNSFRTPLGKGITTWHQDDSPHFLVMHGEPPTNVRLPVLLFTANYYLTDVPTPAHGPTQVIPGSHLFGAAPPTSMTGTKWEEKIVSCCGQAGGVVMFNNQVWHRGGPNESDQVRSMTQVSYARRLIGHKYYPFMNYQMPAHCYENASPRLKRLLGFLPSGAYG